MIWEGVLVCVTGTNPRAGTTRGKQWTWTLGYEFNDAKKKRTDKREKVFSKQEKSVWNGYMRDSWFMGCHWDIFQLHESCKHWEYDRLTKRISVRDYEVVENLVIHATDQNYHNISRMDCIFHENIVKSVALYLCLHTAHQEILISW